MISHDLFNIYSVVYSINPLYIQYQQNDFPTLGEPLNIYLPCAPQCLQFALL